MRGYPQPETPVYITREENTLRSWMPTTCCFRKQLNSAWHVIRQIRGAPLCTAVIGGYQRTGGFYGSKLHPFTTTLTRSFLKGNPISMHGTVLYDRDTLRSEGGFDTSFDACEDYDVYLRLSRTHRVAFYHEIVADYRQHDGNMSRDCQRMLRTATAVLKAQVKHTNLDRRHKAAYRAGLRF